MSCGGMPAWRFARSAPRPPYQANPWADERPRTAITLPDSEQRRAHERRHRRHRDGSQHHVSHGHGKSDGETPGVPRKFELDEGCQPEEDSGGQRQG